MKNLITITSLLAAGTVFANAATLVLDQLNQYNTVIGSNNNTATTASFPTDFTSTNYSDWSNLSLTDTWYTNTGRNNNLGGFSAANDAVLIAAGGPKDYGRSACGAIKFTLGSEYLKEVSGPITFSFNLSSSGGNGNADHSIKFSLFSSSAFSVTSDTYTSVKGSTTTSGLAETTVQLVISAEQVASLAAAGNDVEFIFTAITDETYGSNRGFYMSDFQMNGLADVPEPSAFGLLAGLGALALVGARRRRKTK